MKTTTKKTSSRLLALLVLACAAPLLVGSLTACSGAPSCRSQCDRSAALDCDKDGTPDNTVDCATSCAFYDNANSASGCGGKFGEFSSCLAGIADLCGGTSACDAKLAAWNSCLQTFCTANPGNSACSIA